MRTEAEIREALDEYKSKPEKFWKWWNLEDLMDELEWILEDSGVVEYLSEPNSLIKTTMYCLKTWNLKQSPYEMHIDTNTGRIIAIDGHPIDYTKQINLKVKD